MPGGIVEGSRVEWAVKTEAEFRSIDELEMMIVAQRGAAPVLDLVDRLPEGLALFRRHLAERLHQLRDAALFADRTDAHLIERGEVTRRGDVIEEPGFEFL